jgi:hypothetical protein
VFVDGGVVVGDGDDKHLLVLDGLAEVERDERAGVAAGDRPTGQQLRVVDVPERGVHRPV